MAPLVGLPHDVVESSQVVTVSGFSTVLGIVELSNHRALSGMH